MQQRLLATLKTAARQWPLLLLLVIYKLLEDRFLGYINDFLDEQSVWGVAVLRLAFDNLAFVTWLLIPATVAAITAHAYIQSKVPARLNRLSEECTNISAEILRFLGERTPVPAAMMGTDNWQQEYLQAISDMMSDFDSQFGVKVVRLHDELKETGFEDTRLERSYDHPTNTFGIRDIAFSLGVLGERIVRR